MTEIKEEDKSSESSEDGFNSLVRRDGFSGLSKAAMIQDKIKTEIA